MAETLDRMVQRLESASMDTVADLLDGPRARRAFLLRSTFTGPWALRMEDEAPLTVVAVLRGAAHVCTDAGAEAALGAGDVAVVRGPGHYVVADAPGTPVGVVVHQGQRCSAPDGTPLDGLAALGVRAWGNDASGETSLLTGTYESAGEVGHRLLRALPELVVVRSADGDGTVVRLLAQEVARDAPGQDAVLDRLLDLLLIGVLRTWLAGHEAPAWHRARADPLVGRALALLHGAPARRWTVASLAAETGCSRATLARRFAELVGEPPMGYLAGWRLDLAADLLRGTDAKLGEIARRVGYGSPFALSVAFTRVLGVTPRAYRAGRARAAD